MANLFRERNHRGGESGNILWHENWEFTSFDRFFSSIDPWIVEARKCYCFLYPPVTNVTTHSLIIIINIIHRLYFDLPWPWCLMLFILFLTITFLYSLMDKREPASIVLAVMVSPVLVAFDEATRRPTKKNITDILGHFDTIIDTATTQVWVASGISQSKVPL